MRADKYLAVLFPDLNRSQIQRAIIDGRVIVNDVKVGKKQHFAAGDKVEIRIEDDGTNPLIPHAVQMDLDVLFEDEAIIVVNKKAGIVTHPGNGTGDDTLVHGLLHHCKGKLSRLNGEDRPGIVHRLDKDTSGVLVAAKSDKALSRLIEIFKSRELDKQYLAICCGVPETLSGTCAGPIARHPTQRTRMAVVDSGREAVTDWHVENANRGISLIQCNIHTGRTHQIRVHLSHLGFPIVGDVLYGYRKNRHPRVALTATRPLLHAWKLAFQHPVTLEELSFQVDPPSDFDPWIKLLEEGN